MRCIVDCREDETLENDYLNLNLWGRPCFSYVIDAVKKSACFEDVEILSNSDRIVDYCNKYYPQLPVSSTLTHSDNAIFTISGRAPCISANTIKDAVDNFRGGGYWFQQKKQPSIHLGKSIFHSITGKYNTY